MDIINNEEHLVACFHLDGIKQTEILEDEMVASLINYRVMQRNTDPHLVLIYDSC